MSTIVNERAVRSESAIAELSGLEIAARGLAEKYSGLVPSESPEAYERTRLAIADLRGFRGAIDKRRKELVDPHIDWQRFVNASAKTAISAIEAIEEPLKAAKQAVDDAKEAAKRAAEIAKQRELEAKVRAEREAEEASARARIEADRQRVAAEQAKLDAERAAAAQERAKFIAERAAANAKAREEQRAAEASQLAERLKLQEERQAFTREKLRAREEQEQKERFERREREAKEYAETQAKRAAEAEEAARAAYELERKRLEALKPDVEKLSSYLAQLRAVGQPEFSNEDEQLADILFEVEYAIGQAVEKTNELGVS